MTQATEKDIGKWCRFGNDMIAKLKNIDIDVNSYYVPDISRYIEYDKCTPLTDKQIKYLGLEE